MFLFSDSRCNFPKGNIQVQTEFPFYEPGNTVNGKIFIEAHKPLEASHIEIEVKGGEKAGFTRHYHDQEGNEHSEPIKYHHKFADYKMRVFEIPGDNLQPGSYTVSFQFILPAGIPSSIYYKENHTREKAKAKVKYWVKAIVHAKKSSESMKYKQVLTIREKPV